MPKPLRSPKHLKMIAQLPCAICGTTTHTQAHHLMRVNDFDAVRGMGLKHGDNWVVPLCFAHHHRRHNETTVAPRWDDWERSVGTAIARALWARKGDYEAMWQYMREESWR